MPWFAGHAILFVRFLDGRQDRYPVWENVLLVEADDERHARRLLEERARQDEGDFQGTFRWGERAATWVFAGLRKVVRCEDGGRPDSGSEVSWSEFEARDEDTLRALARGDPVKILYVE